MPRARLIKPGFFTNEELSEIPMAGRLLFAGLWTIADREGRLEDRPKRIKGEIFPHDRVNVDELLCSLASHNFIERYTVNGQAYIQVIAFAKHQHPHVREPESTIPAPGQHQPSTNLAPDEHQPSTVPGIAKAVPGPAVTGNRYTETVSGDPVAVTVPVSPRRAATPQPLAFGVEEYDPELVEAMAAITGPGITPLTRIQLEDVAYVVQDGAKGAWFPLAIARARTNGNGRWPYIKAILTGWIAEGGPPPPPERNSNGRRNTIGPGNALDDEYAAVTNAALRR